MNLDLKGVHFDIDEQTKEHIQKKVDKLKFVDSYIIDLHITITKGKNNYVLESNIHFRWGELFHIKVTEFDLGKGIDQLFSKIDHKASKEKDKIKSR